MNKPSFCFLSVLFVFIIILSACSTGGGQLQPVLQATLDSMVESTLIAVNPTSTPTTTSTATFTPVPTDTPQPVLPTATATPETDVEANSGRIATYTPTSTPEAVLACLNRLKAVNVRELPEFDSPRIDVLEITECAEIVETTEDRLWGKIEKGWVPLEFLDIAAKLDRLPIFEFRNP